MESLFSMCNPFRNSNQCTFNKALTVSETRCGHETFLNPFKTKKGLFLIINFMSYFKCFTVDLLSKMLLNRMMNAILILGVPEEQHFQ